MDPKDRTHSAMRVCTVQVQVPQEVSRMYGKVGGAEKNLKFPGGEMRLDQFKESAERQGLGLIDGAKEKSSEKQVRTGRSKTRERKIIPAQEAGSGEEGSGSGEECSGKNSSLDRQAVRSCGTSNAR